MLPGPARLDHHKALRAHGDEGTQGFQRALGGDAVHGGFQVGALGIAERVLNRSCSAKRHHLIPQRAKGPRDGGLADLQRLSQRLRLGGAGAQQGADGVGVGLGGGGHGSSIRWLNEKLNR